MQTVPNNYSLKNKKNYMSPFSEADVEANIETIGSFFDYLLQIYRKELIECDALPKMSENTNNDHIRKIINVGLITFQTVFRMILYTSFNAEMAFHHSQKAVYYYIEFIRQIFEKGIYMRLSPIDAMTFVFKKTIYDLSALQENNNAPKIIERIEKEIQARKRKIIHQNIHGL